MKHVRVSFDFRLPEHKYPHFIQPTYRNGFKKKIHRNKITIDFAVPQRQRE